MEQLIKQQNERLTEIAKALHEISSAMKAQITITEAIHSELRAINQKTK